MTGEFTPTLLFSRAAVTAKLPPFIEFISTSTDFQAGGAEDASYTGQRVVLEVLMADGVVGVGPKHRRHVTLLEVPQAVGRGLQRPGGRTNGVVEIVEHRYGSHDLGLSRARLAKALGREEIGNERDVILVILAKLGSGRVDSDRWRPPVVYALSEVQSLVPMSSTVSPPVRPARRSSPRIFRVRCSTID